MRGLQDIAADRDESVDARIDAIRRMADLRGLVFLVALWNLATNLDEDEAIAKEAGRSIGIVLNNGVVFSQEETAFFSRAASMGVAETWDGTGDEERP